MSEDLKNYFSFSRRERRGILALVALIILIFSGTFLINYFNNNEEISVSEFEKELDQLIKAQNETITPQLDSLYVDLSVPFSTPQPLDPNTASETQWRNIGISPAQYRVINNYLQKGGRFRNKEDLRKIYSITPEVYNRIEPYLVIKTEIPSPAANTQPAYSPAQSSNQQRNTTNLMVELNTADTTLLQALPGIGPSFARRIVNYRNKLGGFYNKQQLMEVFGMDEERLSGIENNVSINTAYIQRLEINNATSAALQQHPYINKQLSLLIVSYRNQHGRYRNIDDFRKLALVDDELARQLAPYLSYD
jgi:competence protein ComEA